MRRTVGGMLVGLAVFAAAGCGGSSGPVKVDQATIDAQNAQQKQADDDERAMQKEQKKKK